MHTSSGSHLISFKSDILNLFRMFIFECEICVPGCPLGAQWTLCAVEESAVRIDFYKWLHSHLMYVALEHQ